MLTYRAALFGGAILLGAALRLVAYPLPGTTDTPIFDVWSRYAASEGVERLDGTGGRYPERRLLKDGDVATKVDYPPLALDELAIAPPKVLAIAGDIVLTAILLAAVGRGAALAFWLNPAVLLLGAVLGYLDVLYLAPAVAALIVAWRGRAVAAGALIAAACLTKPLAVFAVPAVALALWRLPRAMGGPRRLIAAGAAACVTACVIVVPIVRAGGFLNMLWSVGSVVRDPFLTGAAANLWWLASPVASHVPLDAVRIAGALMTALAIGWALTRVASTPDASRLAAAAGFSVHSYAVLAVSVHENHLCGAIPFLAIAAAGDRRFVGVLAAVSAIAAVNMNVFYGFGVGAGGALPRMLGPVDIMAPLAVANVAALGWFARALK